MFPTTHTQIYNKQTHRTHLDSYALHALSIGHKMNSFCNLPNGVSKVLALFFFGFYSLHRNELKGE